MTLGDYMETMRKGLPGIGRVFPGGHYDRMYHTFYVKAAILPPVNNVYCVRTEINRMFF